MNDLPLLAEILVKRLIDRITSGEATAHDIESARKLLSDQSFEIPVTKAKEAHSLLEGLPTRDEDDTEGVRGLRAVQ